MKFTKLLALFLTLYIGTANAILEVTVLKRIENAFPIVIAPFDVVGDIKKGKVIADIMRDNFNRSGEFSASSAENVISKVDFDHWQEKKAEAIVFGKIEKVSKKVFNVWIHLVDVYSKQELYAEKITVHDSGIRRIAHYLSDQIGRASCRERV